jgi:transcriptional regulator with XRE-family HTH domain
MTPGEDAIKRRKTLQRTQAELAAQTRIDAARLSRIERGLVVPTLEQAVALEAALGIPPSAWVAGPEVAP